MSKITLPLLMVIGLIGAATPSVAQDKTNAGLLRCNTSATLGLIVGSHQKISCSFTPNGGGASDNYYGYINRLGIDVGIKGGGVLAWAVVAPTAGVHHGALAGKYVGASGDASIGLGAGAKVLVGGSHRSIALQPVSVEGLVGVNLALGVAGLTLRSAP
jgi:hypothetical protein